MTRLRVIALRQPVSFNNSAYQWNENPSGGKSMYRFWLIDTIATTRSGATRNAITVAVIVHRKTRIRSRSWCGTR